MRLIEHHGVHPEVPPSAFVAEGACLIGQVTLGRDSSVWFNAVLRGDINGIRIGDRSNVQAVIHGCELCDGSLIGMGAVVLDGARVGPQVLVAAGSVVLEKSTIPEGMLAAGVPARIIRPLTGQERTSLLGSAQHYVEYARSYQRQSTPGDPSCA